MDDCKPNAAEAGQPISFKSLFSSSFFLYPLPVNKEHSMDWNYNF